ncbi:MAG: hypothetical protein RL695_1727 [Pseudomonadota bacterium]|jgi:translocation and assembly module TamA
MFARPISWLFLWLFAMPTLAAESVSVSATEPATDAAWAVDAPEEIARQVRPYLRDEVASSRRLQHLLTEILATEGYFSPQFEFAVDDRGRRVRIEPGTRTTIRQVEIRLDGASGAIDARRREALISTWTLPVGQPFRQAQWNEAKQQLLARLLADEYAAARLQDSSAQIDAAAHVADLSLQYEVGARYRFGALKVEGLQRYTVELVQRYSHAAGLLAGQPYREETLNALQANLQATPYFSSVQVTLDREHPLAEADGGEGVVEAPVLVRVRERAAHRVALGAGASSNTGARVELGYHTPDFVGQAWALNSGLRLEQKKQTAYADLFMPPDPRDRRHSLGFMAEVSDIQGLRSDRYAFGAQTVQQRGSIEQRLSLNWQSERLTPEGVESVVSRALVPNLMWTWRQVDSLLEPRQGSVIQAQAGGGAKLALSDQNFIRLHGRIQHYLPLGRRDTLMLRGELGGTLAPSRQHIPQDYLFRTGGAGAVRGYAYQSLGVAEGAATVGGRYLGIFSAELTHWLTDVWGAAAFVDAGDACDSPHDLRLAMGYGLGARWRSPAGPIGLDLAYGQQAHSMQLHFSLAIPF